MADEELRISVKVDQEKAAENTRLLKDSFRSITDVQHVQRFEALGRQFQLTDVQLKQLGTAILKPNDALSGFAMGFGRAGTILLAFDAAVAVAKYVTTTFSDAASRQLDISNAAKRMGGIHAAQLDANVHAMERERIERGRGIAMMENFSRRRAEFLEHQATDPTTMINLVRRFSDEIEKYYRERGKPGDAERGAQKKREYLERWFGLPDIAQLTADFVKVSKETEEAWDRNQKAAEEFWRVTTDISNNFSKIVSSVLTQTMDDLGIGTLLRTVNWFLERGVEQHDEIGATDPEERAKYLDDLAKRGDAALRSGNLKEFIDLFLRRHPRPQSGAQPQHLLQDLSDKQTDLISEEKRLVENLQFLNAILSGESGMGGQKPTFHNSPQGGAEGESNPVQIPDDAPQPGGGAQAEARKKPKGPPLGGMPPGPGRMPYIPLGMPSNQVPIMVPPTPPGPPEEIRAIANASGSSLVQLGLGAVKDKIFTTSQYLSDPAVRRAMGLQSYGATQNQQLVSETYGFSTGGTGGVVYKPEVPTWKPTLAHELGHVGRNVMREQLAGQEPNILRRYGLGVEPTIPDAALGDDAANPKMEREELQQRALDLKVAQNLKEAGVISPGIAYQRENQAIGYIGKRMPYLPEFQRHEAILERSARGIIEGGAKFNPRTGQPILAGTNEAIDREDIDDGRRRLDRDMGDALDVSGRLNVAVDAPAGTEVKASGGGMFANSVSVDRQMGFEE